jgi:hypothetical protein
MSTQTLREHEEGSSGGSHALKKLRGAAVMYGPAVLLDLFEGTGVLLAALGRLPDRRGGLAARVLRRALQAGAITPWIYLLFVHPRVLRWGATDEETRKELPGDALVPHPAVQSTRAVSIRASAPEVWRWLVQLGQDRGGFYSYDRLENLAGAEIHNVESIVDGMQQLAVGDFVPMAPVEWNVPTGGFTVVEVLPERAVVWRQGWPEDVANLSPEEARSRSTWAFVLEETGERSTRLILRERSGLAPGTLDAVLNYLLMEKQHFVMVRGMLRGIKHRAERTRATQTAGPL